MDCIDMGTPTVASCLPPRHHGAGRPRAGGFRLAAVDIDNTLLGPDSRISAENAAAVHELRRSGVHVVLASGRSHANMLRFHHELGLGDGPIISTQGAVVRPAGGGAPWLEQTMEPELVARVTRDGLDRGLTVQHYRGDEILVQQPSWWSDYDQSLNDAPQTLVGDLLAGGAAGVAKIIWLGEPAHIAAIAADRAAAYDGALTVIVTEPAYLEFSDAATSKAGGLAVVADRLGVTRAQVLAFGDGNNDAPMLAWAGLGVAMDHAKPSAQQAARLVAPSGDPETSLARAVRLVLGDGTHMRRAP
jgi:Cof subfamily protein (haloacid dehalogenase superfamily)